MEERGQTIINVAGDYVQHKEVQYEIGNIETGGIGFQIINSKEEGAQSLYPRSRDYKAVVEWLEKKKQRGEDFYAGSNYNRSEMCRKLSKIFGWEVDENSLQKAQNRKK